MGENEKQIKKAIEGVAKNLDESSISQPEVEKKIKEFQVKLKNFKIRINRLIKINNEIELENAENNAFDRIYNAYGKKNTENGLGLILASSTEWESEKNIEYQEIQRDIEYQEIQRDGHKLIMDIREFFTGEEIIYGIGINYEGENSEIAFINEEDYLNSVNPYKRSTIEKLEETIKDFGKSNDKLSSRSIFYEDKLKNFTDIAKDKSKFVTFNNEHRKKIIKAMVEVKNKQREEEIKKLNEKIEELNKKIIASKYKEEKVKLEDKKVKLEDEKDKLEKWIGENYLASKYGWALENIINELLGYKKFEFGDNGIINTENLSFSQDNNNAFLGGDTVVKIGENKYQQIQLKQQNASTLVSLNLIVKYVGDLQEALNKPDSEKIKNLFTKKIMDGLTENTLEDIADKASRKARAHIDKIFEELKK